MIVGQGKTLQKRAQALRMGRVTQPDQGRRVQQPHPHPADAAACGLQADVDLHGGDVLILGVPELQAVRTSATRLGASACALIVAPSSAIPSSQAASANRQAEDLGQIL